MNRWQCTVCGYIFEGEEPPEFCPVCDARRDEFELIQENIELTEQPAEDVGTVAIVGSGAAGMEAARAVRGNLPNARIHIFSREPHAFYSRFHLTSYLAGEKSREDLFVYPPQWYEEQDFLCHFGEEVKRIVPPERELFTENDVLHYDRLILASGARAFSPSLAGEEKEGVFVLRRLEDADAILAYLKQVEEVAVVGGGVLGLEAAAGLARRGKNVRVFERSGRLMRRHLDSTVSQWLKEELEGLNVEIELHADVLEIEGKGRASWIRLRSGQRFPAQLVLLSLGIWPNAELAEEAGLQVNRGVVVDDFLASSDPFIFAAGDVAEHRGRVYGLWTVSAEQGRLAGQNACGQNANPYTGSVSSVFLKVVGPELASVGQFESKRPEEKEYVFSDPREKIYRKLVLRKEKVVGGVFWGNNRLAAAVERLVKTGQGVPEQVIREFELGNMNPLLELAKAGR